jgi:hypothetical protein
MDSAIKALRASERETAVTHQKRAEEALKRARDMLYDMLEQLEEASEEAAEPLDWPQGMDMVQRTVILIVEQIELRERTRLVREGELPELTSIQERLRDETRITRDLAEETMENDEGGPALELAAEEMSEAMFALRDGRREQAIERQVNAERELRKALAQLLATTFPIPVDEELLEEEEEEESEAGPVIEPISPMDPEGSWRVFFQTSPQGKAVAKTSSEWESLTEREREALNENFARELPLEFRHMLRDYYTELSKMR